MDCYERRLFGEEGLPGVQIVHRGKCKFLPDHETRMRKRAKQSSR